MIPAQHVECRAAPQPRPQRGWRTADLARACTVRTRHPQVGLSIQLKLKMMGQCLGTRLVPCAPARAVADTMLESAGLDHQAEPPAGVFAGFTYSRSDHVCTSGRAEGDSSRGSSVALRDSPATRPHTGQTPPLAFGGSLAQRQTPAEHRAPSYAGARQDRPKNASPHAGYTRGDAAARLSPTRRYGPWYTSAAG
jgi:hypothetical protein